MMMWVCQLVGHISELKLLSSKLKENTTNTGGLVQHQCMSTPDQSCSDIGHVFQSELKLLSSKIEENAANT